MAPRWRQDYFDEPIVLFLFYFLSEPALDFRVPRCRVPSASGPGGVAKWMFVAAKIATPNTQGRVAYSTSAGNPSVRRSFLTWPDAISTAAPQRDAPHVGDGHPSIEQIASRRDHGDKRSQELAQRSGEQECENDRLVSRRRRAAHRHAFGVLAAG
jgi:hypothetical protein